jgi:hypothetical protein
LLLRTVLTYVYVESADGKRNWGNIVAPIVQRGCAVVRCKTEGAHSDVWLAQSFVESWSPPPVPAAGRARGLRTVSPSHALLTLAGPARLDWPRRAWTLRRVRGAKSVRSEQRHRDRDESSIDVCLRRQLMGTHPVKGPRPMHGSTLARHELTELVFL